MKITIALLVVLAAAFEIADSQNLIVPRLIGGVPIDTLRRFPFRTTIETIDRLCGGTILNEQWILTSALCVDGSPRLKLHFEKLYLNSDEGSYTAIVNSDAVHIYPTYYDDIALVKIPFRLIFSDTIKPISVSTTPLEQWVNKLAVLPGFNSSVEPGSSDKSQLNYAMLKILSNDKCGQEEFDEYLQLCAEGWGQNLNTPCLTDYGSGLIVGWPAKSEIIGIYSRFSGDCYSSSPSIYTNVAKYSSWIYSLINN